MSFQEINCLQGNRFDSDGNTGCAKSAVYNVQRNPFLQPPPR